MNYIIIHSYIVAVMLFEGHTLATVWLAYVTSLFLCFVFTTMTFIWHHADSSLARPICHVAFLGCLVFRNNLRVESNMHGLSLKDKLGLFSQSSFTYEVSAYNMY